MSICWRSRVTRSQLRVFLEKGGTGLRGSAQTEKKRRNSRVRYISCSLHQAICAISTGGKQSLKHQLCTTLYPGN